MKSIAAIIEQKLQQQLTPHYLAVINESSQHNVPPHSETHFKLIIVSEAFENSSLIKRHQQIYSIIQAEMTMPQGIHAVSIHCFTPEEWEHHQHQVVASPKCRGGGLRHP